MAKEKTVELKPKMDKISEEHLKELQILVNTINQFQFNIGKLESQKHTLMHELAVTQEKIGGMQEKMIKEYGSADINLMNGTINWPGEDKKDEK
tara:strand:+ start:638 stop:919 length:282 start_codon:yes stop_codon:yes gene_type:complete